MSVELPPGLVPFAVADRSIGTDDPMRVEVGDFLDDTWQSEDHHTEASTLRQQIDDWTEERGSCQDRSFGHSAGVRYFMAVETVDEQVGERGPRWVSVNPVGGDDALDVHLTERRRAEPFNDRILLVQSLPGVRSS